jgi:hypothetical protein
MVTAATTNSNLVQHICLQRDQRADGPSFVSQRSCTAMTVSSGSVLTRLWCEVYQHRGDDAKQLVIFMHYRGPAWQCQHVHLSCSPAVSVTTSSGTPAAAASATALDTAPLSTSLGTTGTTVSLLLPWLLVLPLLVVLLVV